MRSSIRSSNRLFWLLFFISGQVYAQNIGINSTGATPDASAMLDIVASDKGLLIPRVSLTATNLVGPITSPATSLLVYNEATAGTSPNNVVPGYYYWDGSQWIPLIKLGEGGITSKTAPATLSKTETFVVASNDITLTLPAITADDNGLSITIKNTGTHIHQVEVVPSGGSTIDGLTISKHFRWVSKTYVASGGDWLIKGNEGRADNIFDVSANGSWTTIEEVLEFLDAHMAAPSIVRLVGGDYTITSTQTISLDYPITIQGSSYGAATIIADAGLTGPMFLCQSESYFKMLAFDAGVASADAIHLDTDLEYYEVKDCTIDGFEKGIVALTNVEFWVFEVDILNAGTAGIELDAGANDGVSFKISETDFIDCVIGIHFLTGTEATISILSCGFYNPTTGTPEGIKYVPGASTTFSTMFITNNTWNNEGTFMDGFDFADATGRDADAFIRNNSGSPDRNPHCRINVANNTATTAITTAGTWYKANWDAGTQSSTTTKWTIATNRITYQPQNKSDGWAMITGNITVPSNNRTISIAIVKNGDVNTRYGETDLRLSTAAQPYQFATTIYLTDILPGDFFELYCTSLNSGETTTFRDVQWFTETK